MANSNDASLHDVNSNDANSDDANSNNVNSKDDCTLLALPRELRDNICKATTFVPPSPVEVFTSLGRVEIPSPGD